MNIFDEYTTKDLGEAAALVAAGQTLLAIRSSGERHYLFVFENHKSSKDLAERFWSNTLKLPARDYHTSIKVLKARVYAQGDRA